MITTVFAVALALVANLAWATAVGTEGPWFSPAISIQIYSMSLLIATVLALFATLAAAIRSARLSEGISLIETRMREHSGAVTQIFSEVLARGGPTEDILDQEIDEILGIEGAEGLVEVQEDLPSPVSDVLYMGGTTVAKSRMLSLRQLAARRIELRTARSRILPTVGGPLLGCLAFLGLAGAILPGAEGFAVSHYQMNTTLVLFLSYGWWILVAWTMGALAFIHSEAPAGG